MSVASSPRSLRRSRGSSRRPPGRVTVRRDARCVPPDLCVGGACRLPAGACGVCLGGAGLTGRRVYRRSSKRAQQANRELSPKGLDKGVGVARALEYLGCSRNARTFGFGDSGNDLGILAAVEMAVAMGNAMPEVKAVRRLCDRRRRTRRHRDGHEAFQPYLVLCRSKYRSPAVNGPCQPILQNRFAAGACGQKR